jgi:hypothetical protein
LTRGARIAGLAVCAVLLAVEIAWAVRDIRAAGLHNTVWMWLELKDPGEIRTTPGTSGLDLVLAGTLVGALVSGRRAAGTWAFAAAGVFALVYRLPGLWVFTADWSKGAPLHDRALTTSVAFVVGGVALALLALLGRERTGAPGPAAALAAGQDGEPARPAAGAAVAGGLLLVALCLETVGWQIYYIQKYDGDGYPAHLYKHLLTGEGTLSALLDAPGAYAAWATAALALAAAVLAFRKVPAARPLGMAIGLLMVLNGAIDLFGWHHAHMLFKTSDVPDYALAEQGFAVFQIVAGLLLIVLLAQRATAFGGPLPPAWAPQAPPAWQTGGRPPQPPAWGSPYQQPQPPQGYQVPQQSPGAGTFGPPPELPPNLPPGTPPPPAGPPAGPPSHPPAAPPPPYRD